MTSVLQQQGTQVVRASVSRRQLYSGIFAILGLVTIFVALMVLLLLVVNLWIHGIPKFWTQESGLNFEFLNLPPSSMAASAGVKIAIVGSALVMIVTTLASVPIGVAAAIYLEEYARKGWLADFIEINVTNLAGVPSIVYGLLALGLFKYALNLGESILTAGLTLALLVLPVVIVTTREPCGRFPAACGRRPMLWVRAAGRWSGIIFCPIRRAV